jgi:hypothetical protein
MATLPRSWPGRCRSARSIGSVRCSPSMPTPSTTAAPRRSRRSPPSCNTTTPSATPSRTPRSGSSRSICASQTATLMHVPGAWDSTPPCSRDYQLGRPTARHPQHQPRPPAAHPATLCGRPGPSAARTDKEGPQDRRLSARRPHRYPSGRRGHAPILDADPLRSYWLITTYVDPHAAYHCSWPHCTRDICCWHLADLAVLPLDVRHEEQSGHRASDCVETRSSAAYARPDRASAVNFMPVV